jgi:hypothetical protein
LRKIPLFLGLITLLILIVSGACGFISRTARDRIIDHRCTDLSRIPAPFIQNAKSTLHIAYGHTSHGSQLTTGLSGLDTFMGGTGLFSWNQDGSGGALQITEDMGGYDSTYGAFDLNQPAYGDFFQATIDYLAIHPDINVIIWSWCTGVSHADETDINDQYLSLMNQLELDYPNIRFIYMTGHLDGSGLEGNLHQRNEQIRTFCRNNGKWLYDFADIESFDPDGNEYLSRLATDGCNYDFDNSGQTDESGDPALPTGDDRNWALDWQNSHDEGPGSDWYNCGSAHSQPLNANRKAYAAWWLWARLAGWNP